MIIKDNFVYIVKRIERAIDNPTLNRFIQPPHINHDFIWFLYSMFQENGTYQEDMDYITSISLVHLALETHDLIRLHEAKNDQERKLRQLTVLAGDFYSSQYYQLLAHQSDFSMIKLISEAIQKINEYKTSFFNQDLPTQRLFDLIRQIESTLLLNVANYLNLSKWKTLIPDYFFVSRLIEEKQNVMNGQKTKYLQPLVEENPELIKGLLQSVDDLITEGSHRLYHLQQEDFPFIENLKHHTLFRSEKPNISLLVEEG